ncbi:O-acetyl-ADP-ribose deacetylase (regulator of RNase III) [Nocardia sp. GAS34]|uniref:P-loop NTPase fold protein n=1 Tax=unclassified Nocardia TaxID=2637762 RepID=UPI003D2331B8
MTMSDSASTTKLGTLDGIGYSLAQTNRPWTLDVDAMVVSVGSSLGQLGEALRAELYDRAWDAVDFDTITPRRPLVLALPTADRPDVVLTHAILVAPREYNDGHPETTDLSLLSATRSALDAAVAIGARRIAIPLLAAGALTEPARRVARILVPAAIQTMRQHSSLVVEELAFLCREDKTAEVITKEYARTAAAPTSSFDPELAGGISRDLVDTNEGIPLAQDRLDVAPYVGMLATVIADRSTPLPLSVGLFGEWGSGKSYFMAMLRDQIRMLAESGDSRYCHEVVHIGFNAWHYADSNLWASLGDEIFRQLAGAEAESRPRAELIRADMAGRLHQYHQLESRKNHARETAARLQTEVDQAVAERATSARNLLAAVRNSPTYRDTISSMWRTLGIDDATKQAELLADQLQGSASEAATLTRAATTKIGRLSLAAAVAVLGLGVLVPVLVAGIKDHAALGVGLSATVTGLGGLTYLLARMRAGLQRLRTVGEELRGELTKAAENSVNRELADKLRSLRAAEADERVAQAQLDDVMAHVGELGRELAELEPGRRLYSFLAARAQGDSYTGQLGLISTIRKDLQQLVDLMAEWRADPDPDSSRRPIDRIVLYIDDLDRCSPDQIVDVLQAVHLLLAFDLFVVVVGVDPGWLLRSLRGRYAELLRDGDIDADGGQWRTPQDYIQKILNIPLVLPRMDSTGLANLLQGLAEPAGSAADSSAPQGLSLPPTSPVPPVESADRPAGVILIEAGSQVDDIERPVEPETERALALTKPELALLGALDCFIETPRDAKRLLNLYRMVRATRSLSPVSRFLGLDGRPGEFEAVVIILALSTARSGLAGAILDAPPNPHSPAAGGLAHRVPSTDWSIFVADVAPLRSESGWANQIVGPIPDAQVPQWNRIHLGLSRVSRVTTLPDLSDLLIWLPKLRRFSYTLNSY